MALTTQVLKDGGTLIFYWNITRLIQGEVEIRNIDREKSDQDVGDLRRC